MEQDGNAAGDGFDGGDAVSLDGGHEEEVGLIVEALEFVVGDEAVEVDAGCDAERGGEGGEWFDEGALAGEVETPVGSGREGRRGAFELGECADDPGDALVGIDAADGEQAELGGDGTDAEEGCGGGGVCAAAGSTTAARKETGRVRAIVRMKWIFMGWRANSAGSIVRQPDLQPARRPVPAARSRRQAFDPPRSRA